MQRNWSDLALPIYLALCLVLGGASAAGVVANGALQLVGLALIALTLWRGSSRPSGDASASAVRPLLWLIGIAVAWIIAQIIPLPPGIWQALPGRDFVVADDALFGFDNVWRPLSMQPSLTLISATSLLPPLAILLLTFRASTVGRARACWTIIATALISSVLGILQLFQSAGQGAYFYEVTNYGATVGFFSNANHLATLFLIATLLSAEIPFGPPRARTTGPAVWPIVRWALVAFFGINVIVNGSVAGMGLLLAVAAYIALRQERLRRSVGTSKWAIGGIGIVLALAIAAFVWRFSGELSTFADTSVAGEDRLEFAINALAMISASFPVGYGLGAFRHMYRDFENPLTVTSTYVNHLHNDYLELVVEFGAVGIVLLALFAWWFARRVQWLFKTRHAMQPALYALSMGIVIVAAHSLVDYPLRTAAIAAVFAFACGVLAVPLPASAPRHQARSRGGR
ncbi:MAG: O-antigen ligase family protein [Tsuneonella sp.]